MAVKIIEDKGNIMTAEKAMEIYSNNIIGFAVTDDANKSQCDTLGYIQYLAEAANIDEVRSKAPRITSDGKQILTLIGVKANMGIHVGGYKIVYR